MTQYTVTLRLGAPLANAVAVEWTNQPAPVDSGRGWEPCLRLADGGWRFASGDPAAPQHLRGPGPFADLAIRYRVEPAGPWSAAAAPRKDIVIVADEDDVASWLPPVALTAPSLLGAGVIGTELALDPGLWGGLPAPALAFQWRRDGVDVASATARAYAVGPADDGCALACVVTGASPAGAATAVAGPVAARYAPPRLTGALPEEIFDEGTGVQRVETAQVFAGENLAFSATSSAVGVTIDAATGVLGVPTDALVSGGLVTVSAANSGGSVAAELRYTVEAPPPLPLDVDDVAILRSIWRPEGQGVWFTPVVTFPGLVSEGAAAIAWTTAAQPLDADWHPVLARAGEPGAFELFMRTPADNAPGATPRTDFSVFSQDETERRRSLRFRWRMAADRPWSEPSPAFTVPDAPAVRPLLPPPPSSAAIAEAIATPFTTYDVTVGVGAANDSNGITAPEEAHCPVAVALAALSGVDAAFGGRTPVQRTLGQLRHWAANRMPGGRGGFAAKFEMGFVATVAIAWKIDDVRNALTARERARLTLAMKACLIGSAYDVSATQNFVAANQETRTVRGYKAWRTNPNFSLPPLLIPHMVAAFLGREAARDFMETFRRQAFADEIAAQFPSEIDAASRSYIGGARVDMWDTYRQDWTVAMQHSDTVGRGPTATELQNSLKNWRDYRHGATLRAPQAAYVGELERFFSKVIRPGLTPEPGQDPNEPWGVWNSATSRWAGRIIDRTRWKGAPNQGLVGAAFELDTSDAGGVSASKKRSAMGYVHDGLSAILIAMLHAAVADVVDVRSDAFAEGRARMARGMQDITYKLAGSGYQNYAKGGTGTNNDIWSWASRKDDEKLISMHGFYYDTLLPWLEA
jgi:hypothetical protein